MPSLTEKDDSAVMQKALWLLAAVALNAVELAIPRLPFFPWLKPGFANIITVAWIIKYGFKDAVLYTTLRIWISGFYFGFSLFTFLLSICGGLLSTLAMSIFWIAFGKRGLMGTVGMAVTGAMFHNAGQLAVVYLIMAKNVGVLEQFPFMLGASIVFGGIAGMLVPSVIKVLNYEEPAHIKIAGASAGIYPSTANFFDRIIVALAFAVSISLMFVDNIYALIGAVIAYSLIAMILNLQRPNAVLYPLKFYMLFIFIAVTFFFSYGTRIESIPFVTREGLLAFTKQSLRLWCWLQTAHIFKKFKFQEIFMSILHKSFPNRQDTVRAAMTALEHFPEVVRLSKSQNNKIPITELLFRPRAALTKYANDLKRRIARQL